MNHLQTTLYGRIESLRQREGKTYTLIVTPAADEFSRPSKFQIRSDKPFGNPGDLLTISVDISGTVFAKPYTDKKTQQPDVFYDCNVNFEFLGLVA